MEIGILFHCSIVCNRRCLKKFNFAVLNWLDYHIHYSIKQPKALTFRYQYCLIISNCGTGIYRANSVSPWIVNDTFTNIHYRAIYSTRNMYHIDNVFVNNTINSLLYLTCSPNMTIGCNQIIDNIGDSVSDSLIYVTTPNLGIYLTIKDNLFVNNKAANRLMTIAMWKTYVNVFILINWCQSNVW